MQTYRAVLEGDHLEWIDAPPPRRRAQVEVTLVQTESEEERRARGRRMARALQRAADAGGALAEIADPVAWQREIRQDRPLPGRED
ncbi:MAG TPA: hypothetical protein VE871_06240 [Longimicrobium sp.]|nr:hypothetical protein [Longimicrobium sp.]